MGYPPSSLTIKEYSISYKNEYGNLGYGEDFVHLSELLDQNFAVLVGNNGIHTLFGHYYDQTGTGIFNPLADRKLLEVGSEVILTNNQGLSKGYYITQIIQFLHSDQKHQYYGRNYMPDLAYYGNGLDMIYIQYCRWDISLGLLITNIGYRIW